MDYGIHGWILEAVEKYDVECALRLRRYLCVIFACDCRLYPFLSDFGALSELTGVNRKDFGAVAQCGSPRVMKDIFLCYSDIPRSLRRLRAVVEFGRFCGKVYFGNELMDFCRAIDWNVF